ncbi:TetR/AcrR family transcriptional regulator [Vibrio sp. S4M6]|uniref:TetR/AcrR family transcriptional regulator n=1 Tax=Vibrio sinus TaxID=2946865 RepID=UPI00202A7693|nr:TetR/AcrR family transcriptional regulator [Vibrio sinus]MCL9784003.1 TetR/AcrR family transcriptional regulator [Vibrio sinus]
MPWSPNHKLATRERLLTSAAKLFTNFGYDNVGIDEITSDAGLTRGVFYRYFSSKSELYAESILQAGQFSANQMKNACSGEDNFQEQIKCYLSSAHRDGEQAHCPLAFLITDIAHRNSEVRQTYTQMFEKFVEKTRSHGGSKMSRERAIQHSVMMIGGLALSRALSDEALSDEVLQSCIESMREEAIQDSEFVA